jgi:hypothetical protein
MRARGAPSLRFAWKVAAAGGLAGAAGYVLRDLPVVAAVVAAGLFVAVALVTRAVPADVYHALGFRWEEGESQ